MSKECRIENCDKKSVMKGFCLDHYIQYAKEDININGSVIRKNLKLPQNWNKRNTKTKLNFIRDSINTPILKHIYRKDSDEHVKFYAGKRLIELGDAPPEKDAYSCKIPGCKGTPNSYGNFTKGFCRKHYHHYRKGIIDIDGNKIRNLIDNKDKKTVKCKVKYCKKNSYKDCFCRMHYEEFCNGLRDIHGKRITNSYKSKKKVERPLARFNHMLNVLAFMKKELKELRKKTFLSAELADDLKRQVSFLDDNLKFIHNPSFILGSITLLDNRTLKVLLGGEKDAPINVDIELKSDKDKRKFKGTLIKGNNANIAVTEYEMFNNSKKTSETVLFLKDKINSSFPFECEAKDLQGNIIHHIKITESE